MQAMPPDLGIFVIGIALIGFSVVVGLLYAIVHLI